MEGLTNRVEEEDKILRRIQQTADLENTWIMRFRLRSTEASRDNWTIQACKRDWRCAAAVSLNRPERSIMMPIQ